MYDTEKLKARIEQKYGNQAAFAEALGVEKSTVSRYLAGREWKSSTLIKAAKLLDIAPDDIEGYFFAPAGAKEHRQEVKV